MTEIIFIYSGVCVFGSRYDLTNACSTHLSCVSFSIHAESSQLFSCTADTGYLEHVTLISEMSYWLSAHARGGEGRAREGGREGGVGCWGFTRERGRGGDGGSDWRLQHWPGWRRKEKKNDGEINECGFVFVRPAPPLLAWLPSFHRPTQKLDFFLYRFIFIYRYIYRVATGPAHTPQPMVSISI